MDCVFCEIIKGIVPCHQIWEDKEHLAFLSIFPNTLGFSVVITKEHLSSYAFDQEDQILTKLIIATKRVALLLDKSLEGVGRTGMFLEGYGVDHLHSKLFPMHGTGSNSDFKRIESKLNKYFTSYEGYISSHDCDQVDDEKLKILANKIRNIKLL